jgi:hypothetical protein
MEHKKQAFTNLKLAIFHFLSDMLTFWKIIYRV